jgi:hypothetical protein
MTIKLTNPKDSVGVRKVPMSVIPMPVMAEVGLAMLEGARKYGRHNWRVKGVKASVYFDAVVARHMAQWWEGEDIDADSGLSHITKAIASLVVLRDAMIQGEMVDDRPPPSPDGWLQKMNEFAAEIIDRYPNPAEAFIRQPHPTAGDVNSTVFDLKYARQLVERLTLRAEKAEAVLAHAESDYKRMGDELLEVAHRSCERQMQLETVTAQLIIARAELAAAREVL